MLKSLSGVLLKVIRHSADLGKVGEPVFTVAARAMSSSSNYEFTTLRVTTPAEFVKHVELNRPNKRNAMNNAFWREIKECFDQLSHDTDCRAVVVSGAGKMFSAGLDLQDNEILLKVRSETEVGRKAAYIARKLEELQESFNVLEKCPKPVIAAVHNACMGAGINMITACDIRYCTQDALFTIKEVDIGIPADMGTLQRFPKIIGNDSLTRELVYTARNFYADEAKSLGLVSQVFPTKEEMLTATIDLAKVIASKSPVAIQGSKVNLIYSRDHAVPDGLKYQVAYNSGAGQSEDVMKAAAANLQKQTPVFSKL